MAANVFFQSLLRVTPAIALLTLAAGGGAYALVNNEEQHSPLDGADRATLTRPTAGAVLDKTWMASLDTYMDQRLPSRDRMLETHATVTSVLFRDPIHNDVYLNGPFDQLLERPPTLSIRDSLASEAEAVAQIAPRVPTMFVYAPRKEELYGTSLPEAWPSTYPDAHSAIIDAWSGAGEVVDFTEPMQVRADSGTAYFATDHHWTPDSARAAAADVAERLRGLGVNVGTDSRTYTEESADLPFFGSTGRIVTSGATAPDEFTFSVPAGGFAATMCIDDTCGLPTLDRERLNAPGKYANRYAAFIGGDNGLVTITNDSPDARGTVILLKDSYGNAFATYLAERVAKLVVIDERHYTGIPLDAVAAEVRPDAVLVLHNPRSLLSKAFNTNVWTDRADIEYVEPQVVGHSIIATPEGLVLESVPNQKVDPTLADDAQALVDAIDATGVPQFWFYAPRKEQVFADLFPPGVDNPVNANGPPTLRLLRQAHDVTDLSPFVSGTDVRDSMYFRTDHHWTVEAAEVAAAKIVAELEAANVPIGTDDRQWLSIAGPLPFYGTNLVAIPRDIAIPPDDFWYDEPIDGFRSRVCDPECNTPLVDDSYLSDPARDANRYRALLGTPRELVHIHNDDPAARGTIVMLRDSYGNPVAMRLAEQVRDLYLIDERSWTGKPVGQFISDVDADAVIVLHNHVSVLSRAFNRDVWRQAGE